MAGCTRWFASILNANLFRVHGKLRPRKRFYWTEVQNLYYNVFLLVIFFYLNFDSWHFNSCSHKFELKGCEWKRIMQKKRVLNTLQIYRVCNYSVSNTKSQRNVNVAFINHKDFVFTTHFPCRCRNTFQSVLLTWNKWMRNHYMQRINKLNEIPSLCSGFLRTIRALNLSKGVAKIMKNLTK